MPTEDAALSTRELQRLRNLSRSSLGSYVASYLKEPVTTAKLIERGLVERTNSSKRSDVRITMSGSELLRSISQDG